MTHGSLFSGIGGFDLAAEMAGIENIFSCEIDEFCNKILEKNFPNAKRYRNIREFDGTPFRGTVNIVSGGFPCQPFSVAGKRQGKDDDRDLWPEMFRAIKEIRPDWVVGENVAGFVSMELERSLSDLESAGYEVQPFIIPACAVGAPHKRDRVWIIAHTDGEYVQRSFQPVHREGAEPGNELFAGLCGKWSRGENWLEVTTRLCRMDDGLPVRLDGFELTKAGHRAKRIKALGNAIVPEVAYRIFSAIKEIEKFRQTI